jgi:hypothetical protein
MDHPQPKWIKTPRYEPRTVIHISEWKQEQEDKVTNAFDGMVKNCEDAGMKLDDHDRENGEFGTGYGEEFDDKEWDSFGKGLPDQPGRTK